MVLVQPEIVHHHKNPFCPSSFHNVQKGSDRSEDGEGTDDFTFAILTLFIEISTLNAVIFSLIAGLATPLTILPAYILFDELVLNTMTKLFSALASIEFIAFYTG